MINGEQFPKLTQSIPGQNQTKPTVLMIMLNDIHMNTLIFQNPALPLITKDINSERFSKTHRVYYNLHSKLFKTIQAIFSECTKVDCEFWKTAL